MDHNNKYLAIKQAIKEYYPNYNNMIFKPKNEDLAEEDIKNFISSLYCEYNDLFIKYNDIIRKVSIIARHSLI